MAYGPPLGEQRDEWDRTPVESIAKIHGTKKQGYLALSIGKLIQC